MQLRIKRFDSTLPLPQGEPRAAGLDLTCRESMTVPPHEVRLVPSNVAIEIPDGYFLLLTSRSSTPFRKGLMLANGAGIIDPFFCGDKDELQIMLFNFTDAPVQVERGEQLAQVTLMKYEQVSWQEIDTFGTDGRGGYRQH